MEKKSQIKTIIVTLLLALTTPAQILKPLLGEKDAVANKAVDSITYNDGGFNAPHPKKVNKKTPNYLRAIGAGHLVLPFQIEAFAITEDPDFFPRTIREVWAETQERWIACGGQYATIAHSFPKNQLVITVEDSAFWVQGWDLYANGYTDGRNIKVTVMSSAFLISNPSQAYLVKFRDLLAWEIGNSFQVYGHLGSSTIAGEIGSNSPCH